MASETIVVIEVIGEGVTDIGSGSGLPNSGVVPILLYKLCDKPKQMRVKCKPFAFLSGKGLSKKVQFAKRQASLNRSQAAVFVIDSEGGPDDLVAKRRELDAGRGRELPDFPMAIGIAHPCIESWLLASPNAIRRGMELASEPSAPAEPENLAAPCKNRKDNPKTALSIAAGRPNRELSAAEKDKIAIAINDFEQLRVRCPLGFAPFADEVGRYIRPLFAT